MPDPSPPTPTPPTQAPRSIGVCRHCGHWAVYHFGDDKVIGHGPCVIGRVKGLESMRPCECPGYEEKPPDVVTVERCPTCGGVAQFVWVDRQAKYCCGSCKKEWLAKMLPVYPRNYARR